MKDWHQGCLLALQDFFLFFICNMHKLDFQLLISSIVTLLTTEVLKNDVIYDKSTPASLQIS